ncbi:Polysaccharide biosynthesis protein [Serratia fonticola]|uniref:oligosaccharide flippase family protein n=1 Tax=Serratia fonticola TaxID=47917 RepID=UPI0021789530|nr:oligosaccharide flippase family protein [Serratia fonticola]CAI1853544.1 Polysaccharide biosynthesis protein [Serratia fonticola]
MYRKIFSSLAVSVFIKLISFIASIVIARSLGVEGRGELAIILAVYGVAVLVGNFGFIDSFLVFLKERKKDISDSMLFIWCYSLSAGIVVGLIAVLYVWHTQLNRDMHITMLIYAISCPIAIFMALMLNVAIIKEETKIFNISRAMQGALYVIFVLSFSVCYLNVRLVIVSLLLSLLISAGYLYYMLRAKYSKNLSVVLNRSKLLEYVRGCGKLSVSNFMITFTYGLSSLLPIFYLSTFSNLSTVGVYSVSFNLICLGVSLIMPSMAIITAANNDKFSVKNLTLITCFLSIIGVIVAYYSADIFFEVVYGASFNKAGQVFTFLVPYAFLLISAQILSAILRGARRASLAAACCIGSLLISVIILFVATKSDVERVMAINISLSIYSSLAFALQAAAIIYIRRNNIICN